MRGNNKVKRLRAGQVPEWAFNQQENGGGGEQKKESIQYKGVTGDGAGIVLEMFDGVNKGTQIDEDHKAKILEKQALI